ncbi:hypothetical protein [uncultured Tateyamaria sp.]|uniref:hypothetical protein n=1 Tax=uncultured Tateyamaria sp. TaxID=455651 RepID=UPI0026049A23|nr:hypothetical protein [uncultured Tateyamaria sp.]
MKRAFSIVATVAALSVASAAAATEHTILILPDAYFPQITYVDNGDSVRFVNVSGAEHNIIAQDSSWEIGPIADQGEAVLSVNSVTERSFFNKDATGEDGTYIVQGDISFDTAPLN